MLDKDTIEVAKWVPFCERNMYNLSRTYADVCVSKWVLDLAVNIFPSTSGISSSAIWRIDVKSE